MKLLADLHISPRTVRFLRSLGHDVLRVSEVLPPTASDEDIIVRALSESRIILTQDMDFSPLIALSGKGVPSLICLRLSSSRSESVNSTLEKVLPGLERDLAAGAIVTVQDRRVRLRRLPLS